MTIKLGSLARWKRLETDAAIMFNSGPVSGERRIRLHVNVGGRTGFYIQRPQGSDQLLAVVEPGLETLEFTVAGKVGVYASTVSEVWFQTAEDEPTSIQALSEAYVKPMQRRARNPELEHMQFMMNMNIEKRFRAMEADHAAEIAALRKETTNGEGKKARVHERKAPEHQEHNPEAEGATEDGSDPRSDKRTAPVRGKKPDSLLGDDGGEQADGAGDNPEPLGEKAPAK